MTATAGGMKVEITEVQPWVKKLSIEIPLEKIAGESEIQWKDISKHAKIAGFRPGKAPRHVLEKLYQDSVLGEVGNKLINESFRTVVTDNNLEVFGEPVFQNITLEKGKPISFNVVVETFPIVKVPDFSGWKFERVTSKVDEKRIEGEMETFLDGHSELVPVEGRGTKEGDYVFLDIAGSVDGKEDPMLSAKGDKMRLSTDDNNMLKELHKGLIGLSADTERTVNMKLPKQFPQAEMAGKDAEFKVKIYSIKELKRPELTDELIASHTKFKTVAEMKEKLREAAAKTEAGYAEERLRREILKKFRENVTVDLPPKLTAHYSNMYADRHKRTAGSMGLDITKTPGFDEADFAKQSREKGEEIARDEVVLESIGKAEKLAPDEEKMNSLRQEYAEFLNSKEGNYQRNAVMYILKEAMEESVFKFIYGKINITDKLVEPNEVKEND